MDFLVDNFFHKSKQGITVCSQNRFFCILKDISFFYHLYIGYDRLRVVAVFAFSIEQVVKPKCLIYLHHILS